MLFLEEVKLTPLTPFHYPIAYVLSRSNKKLSLPALAVGSMLPDIEIPLMFLVFRHEYHHSLILHSFIGAAIFGTLLTMLITNFAYPPLISALFGVDRKKVKMRCSISRYFLLSCFLGVQSHVLLDLVNHVYRPIFWPFSSSTISLVCQALGGVENASTFAHVLLFGLFMVILVSQLENLRERLFVG
jgi:membrane-bound metal-dependent hydrolase YbcI (DUF457 family)